MKKIISKIKRAWRNRKFFRKKIELTPEQVTQVAKGVVASHENIYRGMKLEKFSDRYERKQLLRKSKFKKRNLK